MKALLKPVGFAYWRERKGEMHTGNALYHVILDALVADECTLTSREISLVDAACLGEDRLASVLEIGDSAPPALNQGSAPERPTPRGAYLRSLSVEGFRGIGPRVSLAVDPGPGLTLVIGRNGSGKSSLAEGLETLMTGGNRRWDERQSREWKEGWRNLHHGSARVEASFVVEDSAAPVTVVRHWSDEAQSYDGQQLEVTGATALAALGWDTALVSHRPFLSYNELGRLLDRKPSQVYDSLAAFLGLEEVNVAAERLRRARLALQEKAKASKAGRAEITRALQEVDDPRARICLEALGKRPADADLDGIEALLFGSDAPVDNEVALSDLRALSTVQRRAPVAATVATAAAALREAREAMAALTGTAVARDRSTAALLEQALAFHSEHGDATCAVCGTPGVLDGEWQARTKRTIEALSESAAAAVAAQGGLDRAVSSARALLHGPTAALARAASAGLGTDPVVAAQGAWDAWAALRGADPGTLAAELEASGAALREALTVLGQAAESERARREERWRPVARQVEDWVLLERQSRAVTGSTKALQKAEAWLKDQLGAIRDKRFAPIAERAQAVWSELRLESAVSLDGIRLCGKTTNRRVEMPVSVDGSTASALGVMSQGELHALALSLFLPRMTVADSPFRFVVVDDPVQSMDPTRVDGLARVLHEVASTRQVIAFTHDDRLFEAVRRLQLPATVWETTRRPGSRVTLVRAHTPTKRYLNDAWQVARTAEREVAARVVPGLCRMALEAAFVAMTRRRRLGRGDRTADVETALEGAQRLTAKAALALFDDAERGADVLPYLNRRFDRTAGDTYQRCNRGAHGAILDYEQLVGDCTRLLKALGGTP